jgi:hypothetical protein
MTRKFFSTVFAAAMFAALAVPALGIGSASAEPADKTVICHSTGSETNPYVRIEVSENAWNGHDHHHDGADTTPGEGFCPGEGE